MRRATGSSAVRKQQKTAALVLTGHQVGNRIEVLINGRTLPLTCGTYQLLVDFVVAQVNIDTGSLEAEAVTVCRLRAAIDVALGAGAGKRLILAGMKHRYRLTIPRGQIKFTPCFLELVDLKIISQEQAARVRACFRAAKAPKKRLSLS